MSELTEFRMEKDAFFRDNHQSPLDPEQRKHFTGLKYFPENPALRFSVALEGLARAERMSMPTSTGETQEYWHVGQIRFVVKGKHAILQVYMPVDGGKFFVPFVDASAPKETYGGGRYLELEDLGDGRLHVDFNFAYNPYCAYNDAWSCPLPPVENRLSVRIEAGEMKFHE
jgi:uncharacterized protein